MCSLPPVVRHTTQVASAWAQAATHATTDMSCTIKDAADADVVVSWLQQHAGQVESLMLAQSTFDDDVTLPLPFALLTKLQRLDLSCINIAAPAPQHQQQPGDGSNTGSSSGAASASASARPLLPALKEIELYSCNFDSVDTFLQLASSPGVTSITLGQFNAADAAHDAPPAEATAYLLHVSREVSRLLRLLPNLVELRTPYLSVDSQVCQHLAAMQHLKHLKLSVWQHEDSPHVAALPTSLTYLCMGYSSPTSPLYVRLSLPAQLRQLSHLQVLNLNWCELQPSVLASMPELRTLNLTGCVLLPQEEQQGARDLLCALQPLTHLERLELRGTSLTGVSEDSLQLFSGLTASPQLTYLALTAHNSQPLPQVCLGWQSAAYECRVRRAPVNVALAVVHSVELSGAVNSVDKFGFSRQSPASRHIARLGDHQTDYLHVCSTTNACAGCNPAHVPCWQADAPARRRDNWIQHDPGAGGARVVCGRARPV